MPGQDVESVGSALRRLVVHRVVIPLLSATAVFWVVKLVGAWMGTDPATVRSWAWIAAAVVLFLMTALGENSPFSRGLRAQDLSMQLSGRWRGQDFEA